MDAARAGPGLLAAEDAWSLLGTRREDRPDHTVVRFPAAVLQVGYAGELPGPSGSIIPYRIHAINEETVILDLNHPLAGEHVVFDVTVVHIQD